VASKRDRLRRLERARTERRIARQAAQQRKRRQIQAGIGASLAVVLIVVGTIWLLGGFKPKPKPTVASGTCTWNLLDPDPATGTQDTGHPPTTGEPHTGTTTMYIQTSLGDIEAQLDQEKAPCTVASFVYLAGKEYFDGSACHRVTTQAIFVLQCGDPMGTGQGRPAYQFANENLPTDPKAATPTPDPSASPTPSPSPNLYPKGTLAMANAGAGTNGSQFFIVYKDGSELSAAYTIFGQVTKGLDIVEKVAAGGAVDANGTATTDGKPVTPITINALTVGTPPPPAPTPSPTPSTGASPAVTTSPSPTGQGATQ
jgi:peptidyl-prolyl cis-trans isomerase B (cyclophilin B)